MIKKPPKKKHYHGSIWLDFPHLCARTSEFIINKHFVYIQIPKSGSSAVLRSCSKKKLTQKRKGYKHEGYAFLKKFAPNKEVEFVATVRNPYSQILSYFFYSMMRQKRFYHSKKKKIIKYFKKWFAKAYKNKHLKQLDYLKINGSISKNITILKYEDKNTFEYLNSKFDLNLVDKKINESRHPLYNKNDIKEFYKDPEVLSLVKKEFKKEFEILGYSNDINNLN